MGKSKNAITKFLKTEVGIAGQFNIEDGAGLSRSNQFTPKQMITVLKYFEPYKDLLPVTDGLFYKSGTLTGVCNLAGYYTDDRGVLGYFAIYGKDFVPIPERVKLAKQLVRSRSLANE